MRVIVPVAKMLLLLLEFVSLFYTRFGDRAGNAPARSCAKRLCREGHFLKTSLLICFVGKFGNDLLGLSLSSSLWKRESLTGE